MPDELSMLEPPRARPSRGQAIETLKVMLELAQEAGQVSEAQALCAAIEVLEQLPRLVRRR